MRIDAHHHVWTLARGDYGWLTPDLAPIYRDFDLADLAPHLSAARIDGTILVQAAPTAAETLFLLDVAEKAQVVRGVAGWTDFDAANGVVRIDALAGQRLVGCGRWYRTFLTTIGCPSDIGAAAGGDGPKQPGIRCAGAAAPLPRCCGWSMIIPICGYAGPLRQAAACDWQIADWQRRINAPERPNIVYKLSGLRRGRAGLADRDLESGGSGLHGHNVCGERRPVVNLAGGYEKPLQRPKPLAQQIISREENSDRQQCGSHLSFSRGPGKSRLTIRRCRARIVR
jgi:L-fuconolactonase